MAEGKRFDFGLTTNPEEIALQTVGQQSKDRRGVDGGPMKTSRSASARGDPTSLSIYSVSEILQGIPAYGSPADALGRYEEMMNTDVALSLKDGAKGDGSVLGDYFRSGLLPPDMHARIGAIQIADGIYTDQGSAAGSTGVAGPGGGTTTAGTGGVSVASTAAFAELESHPRIGQIVPGFAQDARAGIISPNVIWILKFLADNLGNHGLSLFIGVGKTGHHRYVRGTNKESNHYTGRAVDCGITGIPFKDMRGNPGVQVVYDLLASLHSAGVRKPYTCGGPPPQPARASGGTLWFSNPDHYDHFHIDVSQFDGPPDPAATAASIPGANTGGATTTRPASGSSKLGPPIDVGQITTRLPNQNTLHGGKIIIPDAGQIDLQRQVVTLMLELMPTEPTLKPEFYNQMLVAIIESGWAESTWHNYGHGDASSVGIFQLLSMHGTMEQRMNIDFVTRWWWKQAKGAPAKNGKGTAGQLAGQVERPAARYLYKYDTYRNQSVYDLARLGIDARNVDP